MTERADLAECAGCEKLGACCWISVGVGDHSSGREIRLYSRIPCHKLDVKTGLCRDYKNRLEVPWCRSVEDQDRWPHFCAHYRRDGGAIMMEAGRYHQLFAKERTPASREAFMRKIDSIAMAEIEQRFGVKLKPHLGSDYKKRQRLRRAAAGRSRSRGPRSRPEGDVESS